MRDRPLILIAEDYEPMRYAICRILQDNYEPIEVADRRAVLATVRERSPDVVLIDISMAGTDGMAVARELRRYHPDLRVVFVTAHAEPVYVREAMDLGASGYLVKRALPTTLLPALQEVLAGGPFVSPGITLPEAAGSNEKS
jgi:DNA-binding NarL/FixJ family response regulator